MIIFGKDEPMIKAKGIHFRENQEKIILPEVAVGVYSRHLFLDVIAKFPCKEVGYMKNANFERNVYILKYKDKEITFFLAGVGSCYIAADIEELSKQGVKKFIIFGNCGVLDKTIPDCGIIIPTLAFREDGTSYHYVEEGDTILLCDDYKKTFKTVLKKYHFDYREGYVWTTDAFYRETRDKVKYFKKQGAICVDMEASSIAAVCKYLNLSYFTFFYAGDNLDSVEWEERSLHGTSLLDKKKEVMILALELAIKIIDK